MEAFLLVSSPTFQSIHRLKLRSKRQEREGPFGWLLRWWKWKAMKIWSRVVLLISNWFWPAKWLLPVVQLNSRDGKTWADMRNTKKTESKRKWMWGVKQMEKPRQLSASQFSVTGWAIVQPTEVCISGRRPFGQWGRQSGREAIQICCILLCGRTYVISRWNYRSVNWVSETHVQVRGLEWRSGLGNDQWIDSRRRKSVCS